MIFTFDVKNSCVECIDYLIFHKTILFFVNSAYK